MKLLLAEVWMPGRGPFLLVSSYSFKKTWQWLSLMNASDLAVKHTG